MRIHISAVVLLRAEKYYPNETIKQEVYHKCKKCYRKHTSFGSQRNLRGLKYSRIKNRTLQFDKGRSMLIFLLGANQRKIEFSADEKIIF